MRFDGFLANDLAAAGGNARALEEAGYDGAWMEETSHDPFLPLVLAAEETRSIEIGTAVAVAFARNPMTLASTAWDLQHYSGGRFRLGLGSQVQAHVTRRFGMPWSKPAARMRELVTAIRAIWDTWQNSTPLAFRGEFYTHTLMTPMFSPAASDLDGFGPPKVLLAGVGELMTEVAGEVCDGFICHGFTTERYLREVTLPALARGRERAGRTMDGFEVVCTSFIVTGRDEAELAASAAAARARIAFYGSTPAYHNVLDLHGWGDRQERLSALARAGEWESMAAVVDDEILSTFAVVAPLDELGAAVQRRFGGLVQRMTVDDSRRLPVRQRPDLVGALRAR